MPAATRCEPTHRQRSLVHHASDLLAQGAHATIAGGGPAGCTDLWQIVVAARVALAPHARNPTTLLYVGTPEHLDGNAEERLPRRLMGLPGAHQWGLHA